MSDDEVLVTEYWDLDGIDLSTDEHVFLRFQTNALQAVAFQIDVLKLSSFFGHKMLSTDLKHSSMTSSPNRQSIKLFVSKSLGNISSSAICCNPEILMIKYVLP